MTDRVATDLRRRPPVALVLLLLAHLLLLVHSAVNNSACFDEGPHLAAGMAYLRHDDTSVYDLSPPLLRGWAALPAFFAGADAPPSERFRSYPDNERHWVYFDAFQAANLARLRRYVLWGRFMLMPFSLAGAAAIFFWARRAYGDLAATAACAAWCFDPTVIAHGSTLGTDMATAVVVLFACGGWLRFLRRRRKTDLALASSAVALAHAIKFSAILLWPVLLGIAALEALARRTKWSAALAGIGVCLLLTLAVVDATYRFRLMGDRLDSFHFASETMQRVSRALPKWLPVPFPRYMVRGVDAQKAEAEGSYVTTLFGKAYYGSDWRYYPWLLASKTPVGTLVFLLLGATSFVWIRPGRDDWPLVVMVTLLFVGIQWGAQMNIGIRYLLPVYAPAFLLASRCVRIAKVRPIALLAILAIAAESLAATPRLHSFSNLAVAPWRNQVTNRDWGQSLIALREWMAEHEQSSITLLYFGTADPAAYEVRAAALSPTPATEYIAVSHLFLDGLPTLARDKLVLLRPWRQLRAEPPVAELSGMSIYRTEDVLRAEPQPWIRISDDWEQAMKDPAMNPIAP